MGKLGSLGSNPLEEVVDEAIHDAHGLRGDSSVRVDLLQHLAGWIHFRLQLTELEDLVDVDCVGLLPLSLALFLVALGDSLSGLARLSSSFTRGLGRHLTI